ncbi:MAG: hypothetical protein WBG10_04090 [Pseudolabrys sp.]
MPDNDLFLQAIEAVYASGLESDRLPEALDATSRLLGAAGATLEVLDKATQRHRAFYAAGLADVARAPYLEEFAALNPRYLFISRLQPVVWRGITRFWTKPLWGVIHFMRSSCRTLVCAIS